MCLKKILLNINKYAATNRNNNNNKMVNVRLRKATREKWYAFVQSV